MWRMQDDGIWHQCRIFEYPVRRVIVLCMPRSPVDPSLVLVRPMFYGFDCAALPAQSLTVLIYLASILCTCKIHAWQTFSSDMPTLGSVRSTDCLTLSTLLGGALLNETRVCRRYLHMWFVNSAVTTWRHGALTFQKVLAFWWVSMFDSPRRQ